MRLLKFVVLFFSTIACGGNTDSNTNDGDDIDLGLGGEWRIEFTEPKESEAIETLVFAKDYNTCMERADAKNNADHNRCDKSKSGDKCHDKADKQYEDNRASCERVAHSDNLKETGQSWSAPAGYKPTGTPDGNGSRYHQHD